MCVLPKQPDPPAPTPAPPPPVPVAPIEAPKPMAIADEAPGKKKNMGLSQLRISNKSGGL